MHFRERTVARMTAFASRRHRNVEDAPVAATSPPEATLSIDCQSIDLTRNGVAGSMLIELKFSCTLGRSRLISDVPVACVTSAADSRALGRNQTSPRARSQSRKDAACGRLGRPGCSRLTGIDPVPVAPPAVGVRAEVRAKKTATSSPGASRWWGLYCILRLKPKFVSHRLRTGSVATVGEVHRCRRQPQRSAGIDRLQIDGDVEQRRQTPPRVPSLSVHGFYS